MRSRTTRGGLLALGLIAAIGAGYLATLRAGHDWGDDFSAYLQHAKNIAEGRPYASGGYLYNPANPIGPPACPPVFPLLLAPVYALFGLNLTAMKAAVVLWFLAALFMMFLVFRRLRPDAEALALVAIIGVNPLFWSFKDQVLSDVPFLCFTYASFWLIAQHDLQRASPRPRWLLALATGLVWYLAYGTRSLGLLIPAALVIALAIRRQRPSRSLLIALLLLAGLIALQNLWLHTDRAYLAQLGNAPKTMWSHAAYYSQELRDLWRNGYSKPLMKALFLTVNGLALLGYGSALRRGVTMLEVFPLLYLAAIFSWPHYQGIRYLFPVIPLYVAYALSGIRSLPWGRRNTTRRLATATVLIAIFASYAAAYTKVDYGPIKEGVAQRETVELFDYIRRDTDPSSVIVFAKPRVLSLYTGRRSAVYPLTSDGREIVAYLRRIGAAYVVASPIFFTDQSLLQPVLQRHAALFEPVYANAVFTMYRMAVEPPPR
ncbi:MAG: glycosyltransferase family 39 protein [Candidatus Omnitrophica bacterium]|nr:glycosyltransferase family 39 protein [Candidatus Omnitrophota bacterium]